MELTPGNRFIYGLGQIRQAVIEGVTGIPGWSTLDRAAARVFSPVQGLVLRAQARSATLRKLEWLVGLSSFRRLSPAFILIVIVFAFWRGLRITPLGHIGTDPLIYPLLAAASTLNPPLAVVAAVSFGVGDLVQKTLRNDIYLAETGSANHVAALGGYAVAYSALVVMGLLPGVLSRVARRLARRGMNAVRPLSASADGEAVPGESPPRPFAELVAGVAGAAAGGYAGMHEVAPTLEEPAFLWRPDPDESCLADEVQTYLEGRAGSGALGGGAGNAADPEGDIEGFDNDDLLSGDFGSDAGGGSDASDGSSGGSGAGGGGEPPAGEPTDAPDTGSPSREEAPEPPDEGPRINLPLGENPPGGGGGD